MKFTDDYSSKIAEAKTLLGEADAIIIGIGSGLSAAGGLNYGTPGLVKNRFPDYHSQGVRSIMELLSLYWPPTITKENATKYWGVWARHIKYIRDDTEVTEPYIQLFNLVSEKPYFVITTNADGQTQKSGFDSSRIFAPQGDYSYLQCPKPCSDSIYENENMITSMNQNMKIVNDGVFEIRKEEIPHCPNCGSFLIPNLRCDNNFVEKPHMKNQVAFSNFIRENSEKKLVLLELGVGFNTPVLIRYPFERMTDEFADTKLIRVNSEYADVPEAIRDKSICISADLGKVMSDLS